MDAVRALPGELHIGPDAETYSPAPVDARTDAGPDAGSDASSNSGPDDVSSPPPVDAHTDAGSDASTPSVDAHTDAGPDASSALPMDGSTEPREQRRTDTGQ